MASSFLIVVVLKFVRVFDLKMRPRQFADAVCERKRRGPLGVRAFVRSSPLGQAGLSDDLGSLQKDRTSDRGKQNEGGGERGELGHLKISGKRVVRF